MNTVSFKQYIEEIADPKIKKSIRTYGIIGYILAGINLILAIAFVPLGIIDVLWITGLSLGIHLGKSRVCAIIFLILGIISCGLATVQNGSLSGYWIPLLGI